MSETTPLNEWPSEDLITLNALLQTAKYLLPLPDKCMKLIDKISPVLHQASVDAILEENKLPY